MQEKSFRLYTGAYDNNSKAELRLNLLAVWGVVLQLGLVFYLIFSETFSTSIIVVFLLNLIVPAYFLVSYWLDKNYKYRRHLTFTDNGVSYRLGFFQDEHHFDWEEVENVKLSKFSLEFLLKNEELHLIEFENIQNDEVLISIHHEIALIINSRSVH